MIEPRQLGEGVSMRVLRLSDAVALAAAYVRNRAYLSPWEPVRPEEYYTADWQSADIGNRLVAHEAGEAYPFGLFDGDRLVGRFNLAGIVRGPFQNAGLGYWVDGAYAGRGLASAAVRAIVEMARDELGLHRIEGALFCTTLPRSGCCLRPGSSTLAWHRDTCRSPENGKTTISTKWSYTIRTVHGLAQYAIAMQIRECTLDDLAQVITVCDASERTRWTSEMIAPRSDRVVLVAVTDGGVIGVAKTHFHPNPEGGSPAGHYLGGVVVAPGFRRRGVGSGLVDYGASPDSRTACLHGVCGQAVSS